MRRRRRSEEAAHHDRWLVSYADFMTLLFALFVVLFSSSRHDRMMIPKLSKAIRGGFQHMGAFGDVNSVPEAPISQRTEPDTASAGINIAELQKELQNALGKEIERQEVVMRMTPEGFVISLRELGFFDSGQARLLPGASYKMKRIASVLMKYGLDMRVEGHSDNVPIHNAAFGSNWDLATARAMAVAMMLLNESGFDPRRISIAGYGQYRPAASNDTPEGRKVNRRVDLVVVSASSRLSAKTK